MTDTELRATFIVRLWREPGTPPGTWCGEVYHVQAGQTARGAAVRALFDYIQAQLALLQADRSPPSDDMA
jgi:hypothetical protein